MQLSFMGRVSFMGRAAAIALAAVLLVGLADSGFAADGGAAAKADETPVAKKYPKLDDVTDYPKPPAKPSTKTGIWKAFVPHGVKGEFDSYDPVGLMAGDLIKADCSLNWRDEDGKLYCFSSGTSLVYFKDWPHRNIRKARKAYHDLTEGKPGS